MPEIAIFFSTGKSAILKVSKDWLLCTKPDGNMRLPKRVIQKGRYLVLALDYENLGKLIKHYRNKQGISQEKLGEMININSQHVSNIENGRRYPSLETVVAIANSLDITVDDLLVKDLNKTSSSVGKEIHEILQNCNRDEKEMLTQILKFMKELFMEYGI